MGLQIKGALVGAGFYQDLHVPQRISITLTFSDLSDEQIAAAKALAKGTNLGTVTFNLSDAKEAKD